MGRSSIGQLDGEDAGERSPLGSKLSYLLFFLLKILRSRSPRAIASRRARDLYSTIHGHTSISCSTVYVVGDNVHFFIAAAHCALSIRRACQARRLVRRRSARQCVV